MAKAKSDGTDFNFGFNAVKAAKKPKSKTKAAKKRKNPIREWRGIKFGSGD